MGLLISLHILGLHKNSRDIIIAAVGEARSAFDF